MMGLGWQELVIVLVIIMIIFGAGKLPQVAKSLGQGVKEFKTEAEGGSADARIAADSSARTRNARLGPARSERRESRACGPPEPNGRPVTHDRCERASRAGSNREAGLAKGLLPGRHVPRHRRSSSPDNANFARAR